MRSIHSTLFAALAALALVGCQAGGNKPTTPVAERPSVAPGSDAATARADSGASTTAPGSPSAVNPASPPSAASPTAPPAVSATPSPGKPATSKPTPGTGGGAVTVKLNLAKGRQLKYVTEVESTGMTSVKQKVTQQVSVKEKSDSGYTMEFTVVDMSVDGGSGPSAQRMADEAKKAMGTSYTVKYDEFGRTSDKQAFQRAASAANPMASGLAGMEGIDIEMGFMEVLLPNAPVTVGSQWRQEIDLAKALAGPMAGMAKLKRGGKVPIVYEVTSVEVKGGKTLMTIRTTIVGDVELSINMGGAGTPKEGASAPRETNIAVKLNSIQTAIVDTATGLPISVQTSMETNMDFGGMKQKQTAKSTTKLVA